MCALAGMLVAGLFSGCGGGTDQGEAAQGETSQGGTSQQEQAEGTSEGEEVSGQDTAEKPSGKLIVGGYPVGDTAFEAVIEGFQEEYPDIELEFQFLASSDYHKQLQTALAAGTGAPDVAMVEGAQLAMYRDADVMENLLDAPYNAGEMKDDFVDFKWEPALSYDGTKLSGLVWDIGPASYFYRADIFEEVGLPSEPEAVAELMSTYDGVLEVAEKVYVEGQRWLLPSAVDLYTWNFLNRNFYDEDLNLQIDNENARKALEAAITMRNNGWDAKVSMWDNEANIMFNNGSLVSVVAGCWYGGSLKTSVSPDNSGKWAVTSLPAGIPDANWGGSYVCIPKQCQNKEAAWAFVKYMMANKDVQNTMFSASDLFPGYKPAWDDPLYDEPDEYFGGQKVKRLWADIAEKIEPVFSTYMDATAEEKMNTVVSTSLDEGKSVDEILEKLESEIMESTKQEFERQEALMQQ